MTKNKNVPVVHRPPGYRGWADEQPFRKPSLMPLLMVVLIFASLGCGGR